MSFPDINHSVRDCPFDVTSIHVLVCRVSLSALATWHIVVNHYNSWHTLPPPAPYPPV